MPPHVSLSSLFDISQNGDRWECRPTGWWSQAGCWFSLFGGVFCLYLAGTFFWNGGQSLMALGFGAVLLAASAMLTWQAFRFSRLRRVPLTIESNGRVSYDAKELCPPGSVRSVQMVPDPQAESGDCKVVLEHTDGRCVELEGPFFGAVTHREAARVLAGELAKALKVEVVETEK
jgi:hypothetical protein